jgi:hypothetical protein
MKNRYSIEKILKILKNLEKFEFPVDDESNCQSVSRDDSISAQASSVDMKESDDQDDSTTHSDTFTIEPALKPMPLVHKEPDNEQKYCFFFPLQNKLDNNYK